MDKNENCLEHARHNDLALKYLDKKPDFLDWVITMCFYSSLHYVKYYLFPITLKATNSKSTFKIQTFEQYCTNQRYGISAHKVLNDLVENHASEIAFEYSNLFDLCHTARYVDYKIERDVSNHAKQLQKNIKEFCEKA